MKKTGIFALFPRTLLIFMIGMVFANVASMMYMPLLPLYLQHLGADVGQIGLFFTLSAILPLFFQIFGGWISDSIGRLRAVAIGGIAGFLTFIFFLLAPSWEWALLAMAVMAIGRSFVAPSFRAFIAEQSSEDNRGKVFGIADTIFAVVGVIGPPLGGWISDQYGFQVMFFVAGAIFFVATVIRISMAFSLRKQPATETNSPKTERPSWKGMKSSFSALFVMLVSGGIMTWILINDGVIDITFGMVNQLLPIYMQNEIGISLTQIGFLESISAIATMVVMAGAGWLSDKKGEKLGIALGNLLFGGALAIFLISQNIYGLIFSWALFGMGSGMVSPAYNSLISKAVPEKLRGMAFGLFSTSVGLVSLPSPFIGAFLYETFSPRLPFILPMFALLISVPLVWIKFDLKKYPPAENEMEEEAELVPANVELAAGQAD